MEINVVYASDNNYVIIMGVSILSLLKNTSDNDTIRLYILSDNISIENKLILKSLIQKYRCSIKFFEITEKLDYFLKNNICLWRGGVTTLARIFISDFLPESVHRIIYLDCDTLINSPLDNLFNLEIQEKTIGACCDCFRNELKKSMKIDINSPFFNVGVLLINLDKWKEKNYKGKLFNYLLKTKNIKHNDQEAINVICKDDILTLDIRYNFQPQLFLFNYKNLLKVYNLKEYYWYGEKYFNEAKYSVCIYHFSGETFIRPWFKNSKHPIKVLYDKYYYCSPWARIQQTNYKISLKHKIQYVLFKYVPETISAVISCFLQRFYILVKFKI